MERWVFQVRSWRHESYSAEPAELLRTAGHEGYHFLIGSFPAVRMEAVLSAARQSRTHYRHELRSLTYVTLDEANGGIIRNVSQDGIAIQAVTAVRPLTQLRARFELRSPRVRVEAVGEVVWTQPSGVCGIRFLDLPARLAQQINAWIFSNLLEGMATHADCAGSMFSPEASLPAAEETLQSDGLMVSPAPVNVIELPVKPEIRTPMLVHRVTDEATDSEPTPLDWLSQPLSAAGLAWMINTLAVVAAVLLFVLVFLVITRDLPPWPFAMTAGAALGMVGLYRGFFKLFGGTSPGVRLARLVGYEFDCEEPDARFR